MQTREQRKNFAYSTMGSRPWEAGRLTLQDIMRGQKGRKLPAYLKRGQGVPIPGQAAPALAPDTEGNVEYNRGHCQDLGDLGHSLQRGPCSRSW